MESEAGERVATEIELLESMYPDQVSFDKKARDLSYKSRHASMQIRLPDSYLVDSLPDILSASAGKEDVRQAMKEAIGRLEPGEEVLDSIISSFNDLVAQTASQQLQSHEPQSSKSASSEDSPKATVIVYLHHLLNTNKRKMCLSPPDAAISGITKAGYPGVLIYSGPSEAVHEHVNELKGLNWAAFQVRSEMEGEEWDFKHGKGMIEVESMGDVVAELDLKEGRKETYMEAMRMK